MVLTVDIGNTNIVLGVFDGDRLTLSARISTDKSRTSDEYSVMLKGIFEINGLDLSRFEGIILSSVVPQLNEVMCRALSRFTAVRVLTVGPGLRTGFQILADDPTELGADQVCNVAGALTEFAGPLGHCGLRHRHHPDGGQQPVEHLRGHHLSRAAAGGGGAGRRHRPAAPHPAGGPGKGLWAQHGGVHAYRHRRRDCGDD